jgi:uncharacterized damage-inducible protein DinB
VVHPLVLQLRFTRSEFKRGMEGVSEAAACRRLEPMNCLSWNVGHLAWQEQRYWLQRLQGTTLLPELDTLFCYGCPPATPVLAEMWQAWHAVTAAADPFLDSLTTADLLEDRTFWIGEDSFTTSPGNLLQRVIYHYWYHNGENQAIRQLLGPQGLQDFVGNIDEEAPFRV